MEYKEILEAARKETAPHCMACPVCNGKACANSIPGPGSKFPGVVAARNYEKWQEICVNMDTLCENIPDPDVSFELFGRTFSAPVFVAPLGAVDMHYGSKYNDLSYNAELIRAAVDCGILAFTGDGVNPDIMRDAIRASAESVGGLSIPTIKPWSSEVVFGKLDMLVKNDIFAAAMDVDAAGLPFLKKIGGNAGSKTVAEMREIISRAGRPFIIKGIMTVAGAKKAVEAGAAGIIVSNHGGRVQGGVPSTAEVLGEIADAVKGQTVILVDGGIRSGLDIFRAIALGADAVLVGRPFATMMYGAGAEGVKVLLDKLVGELKGTMTMCGAATLKDISRDMIRI
ncbi:MAG: alpha-hydroxy-acid oxidizing protein [Oscillospiraceae bacterium]|nr:alpha-hydroxy-acid oxidizing protein [Oscillospiraceae bacterium]